jgi:hypothetical protein
VHIYKLFHYPILVLLVEVADYLYWVHSVNSEQNPMVPSDVADHPIAAKRLREMFTRKMGAVGQEEASGAFALLRGICGNVSTFL